MVELDGFILYLLSRIVIKYIRDYKSCYKNIIDRYKTIGKIVPIRTIAIPFYTISIDFILGLSKIPLNGII